MSEALSNAPLGDVATRLMHEDERVKVWELRLAPGEETAPHHHLLDHVIILIDGDRIAGVPHALSTGVSAEYFESEVTPGAFFMQKKGGIEIARNTGDKPFLEILIEFKD